MEQVGSSIVVSFANPSAIDALAAGYVTLGQEEWSPYVNSLTKMGLVSYLGNLLTNGPALPQKCNTDGVLYRKKLYAYPSNPLINYSAHVSWGQISGRIVDFWEKSELIQLNLQTKIALDLPALSIVSHEWQGDTYNADGEIVSFPGLLVDVNGITATNAVYGTVLVKYLVVRHTYEFTVSARAGALEHRFQSFFYALWHGGNTQEEIKAPPGAEENVCNVDPNGNMNGFGNGGTGTGGTGTGGTGILDTNPRPNMSSRKTHVKTLIIVLVRC